MFQTKRREPKVYKTEQSVRDFVRDFKKKVLSGFSNWIWLSATEADLDRVNRQTVQENLQRLERFMLQQAKNERDKKQG